MNYDVVVVGGGPAGSSAAMQASELGLRTALLDKYRFPRPKVCGGGLTKACLEQLPGSLPARLVHGECHTIAATYGAKTIRITSEKPLVTQIDRQEFDNYLLNMAAQNGVGIHDGVRVEAMERESHELVLHTNKGAYSSEIAILADGATGRLSSSLLGPLSPAVSGDSLGFCRVTNIPSSLITSEDIQAKSNDAFPRDEFEVVYGVIPTGYIWVFPKSDYLSVGIGGPRSEMTHGLALLKEWILQRFPSLAEHLEEFRYMGGFLPRRQRNPVPFPRVMLAGDAAGFVDPFLGEGIRYALISGRLAARQAAVALNAGKLSGQSSLSEYSRACYESFGKNLKDAEIICKIFRHLNKVILDLYFSSAEPFAKSVGILEGSLSYRDLAAWLLCQMPGHLSSIIRKMYSSLQS